MVNFGWKLRAWSFEESGTKSYKFLIAEGSIEVGE